MPYNYCFYIHHHGAGHLMRAVAIANKMPEHQITFIGSDLMRHANAIPDYVDCIHLPMDTPTKQDRYAKSESKSFLHYTPLNVHGLLERNGLMIDFFRRNPQTIIIVDVSSEVTLLARLCGIPSVVIRQHGNRTDPAHALAYESAELIVAPFSQEMDTPVNHPFWNKTLYAGGFSRYTDCKPTLDCEAKNIGILIGEGGSPINSAFVHHLRKELPKEVKLHVVGKVESTSSLDNQTHVFYHGRVDNPQEALQTCSRVICNAGHNTIMELADLRKKIICIPAERPFNEQTDKAFQLERLGCAVTVLEQHMYTVDWNACLNYADCIDLERLQKLTSSKSISNIKKGLESLSEKHFVHSTDKVTSYEQYS